MRLTRDRAESKGKPVASYLKLDHDREKNAVLRQLC